MHETKILLASRSARRAELLRRVFPSERIIVIGSDISENRRKGERVETFCKRVAQEKAADVWGRYAGQRSDIAAVVGADTVILFRGRVIGQPEDSDEAIRILKQLSGKCHEVITGVAVLFPRPDRFTTFIVKSKVWMHKLGIETIEDYVATGEPLDKAGAYAIQSKGRSLVERYEGSYTNIVGLPLEELKRVLNSPE
jgi:septum formation protein